MYIEECGYHALDNVYAVKVSSCECISRRLHGKRQDRCLALLLRGYKLLHLCLTLQVAKRSNTFEHSTRVQNLIFFLFSPERS